MINQSFETEAEPIVQLTDMPQSDGEGVPATLIPEHNHQSPTPPTFDKGKLILPIAIIFAAILISSSLFYTKPDSGPKNVAQKPPAKVEIDLKGAMVLGDPKAPVTIVEYGDYQCSFCARYFQENEAMFISQYVETGKARFVWKDYAFLGQESIWAAGAARCANDQGKFWEYHNYLFNNQGTGNSGAFSKSNLKKFASILKLNMSQFNTCLDSDKYTSVVQEETQAGSAIGVNGTPATFINGQLVVDANGNSVGAAPFTTFKSIIDKILSK